MRLTSAERLRAAAEIVLKHEFAVEQPFFEAVSAAEEEAAAKAYLDEGDQGETGSAGVEARRARRPILCIEANGGGRPGDR
jgi:hypothetical protein